MNVLFSLIAVLVLIVIAYVGSGMLGLSTVFGAVIPAAAIVVFIVGICWRVVRWARSPVPFRIPTTCGQQYSLPWIKSSFLENPHNTAGVIGRMALEILAFRSLFRNTRTQLKDQRLYYWGEKYLWAAALAFHYSFLVIFLRHFRFFVEPTPFFVPWLQTLDGFFEIGVPVLFMSDIFLLGAVGYLFFRRIYYPQVRYISLAADYFPLFLILAIGISGVLMRHFYKVDLLSVKSLMIGLFSFHPPLEVLDKIGVIFYVHLFLVSSLLAYFPFSKLVHMAGVFLSPTRNLANNNRMVRHVNPWNYPVKTHSYQEWEEEFHDLIKDCGLPLEKE